MGDSASKFSSSNTLLNFTDIKNLLLELRHGLGRIVSAFLLFLSCYLIYFIIIAVNYKTIIKSKIIEKLNSYFILIILAFLIASVVYVVNYKMNNSIQFLANLFSYINIVLIVLFIVIFEKFLKNKKFFRVSFLTLFVFIIVIFANLYHINAEQNCKKGIDTYYSENYIKNIEKVADQYSKITLLHLLPIKSMLTEKTIIV